MQIAFLALALTFIFQSSPPDRSEQQEPANKKTDAANSTQAAPAESVIENQKNPCKESKATTAESQKTPEKSFWGDLPTWLLFVVGGVTAWIAIRTLRDIRQQTRNTADAAVAAKNSAEAALLNAKAVINSERAWVFCHWRKNINSSGCSLFMQNHGRTPAEIIDVVQRDRIADLVPWDDNASDMLPYTPDYGQETILIHSRVLPQAETWTPPEWEVPTHKMPPQGRKSFFFYGKVRYRDVLPNSEIHETCFCYFWSPTICRFIIGGPPAYTKYT